jgi:membrane-associated phospholipid phosphatase
MSTTNPVVLDILGTVEETVNKTTDINISLSRQLHLFYFKNNSVINGFINFIICIVFMIYVILIRNTPVNRNNLFFVERDPSLSNPLIDPTQVPNSMLTIISITIPAGIVALYGILKIVENRIKGLNILYWLSIALIQSILISMAIYNTIKIYAGRPRPCFFALCKYKGYDIALETNNFTSYFSETIPGIPGNIAYCTGSDSEIEDSLKSFPSGHAGLSFASMTFTFLLINYIIGSKKAYFSSIVGIISLGFLYLSGWIALSRPKDKEHNYDDITVGALIGIVTSSIVFDGITKNFLPIRDVPFI